MSESKTGRLGTSERGGPLPQHLKHFLLKVILIRKTCKEVVGLEPTGDI